MEDQQTTNVRRFTLLNLIEWCGNKLPEPATLFVICALLVMVLSHVGSKLGWAVQPVQAKTRVVVDALGNPVLGPDGKPKMEVLRNPSNGRPLLEAQGEAIRPVSLLTRDGAYWAISGMVDNFVRFPPLGMILTAMLGVGVAERTGLISAVLKALARIVPNSLLTPMILFLGVNASLATDAGYLVLPPAAAVLYLAAGRSPVAGIAVAFAGVAAGFGANLFLTASDAIMSGFTETAARIIDPKYSVSPACNWYFLASSTFVLAAAGWCVSAWFVEPRLAHKPTTDGGPAPPATANTGEQRLTVVERRGVAVAGVAYGVVLTLTLLAILHPHGPLHGLAPNSSRDRWILCIVPIIFLSFLVPGIAYGIVVGAIRREGDVISLLVESFKSMGTIAVVYFFAAQFIRYFDYTNLGRMFSMYGAQALATSQLSAAVLLVLLIILTLTIDLFFSSMSAKYAIMAPIFVPMFMLLGISPELTQAAYRIGDSVMNVVGPLNPYLVIILAEMRKYDRKAGMGTLLSMMTPYGLVFAAVWIVFLLLWMQAGLPIGRGGPLQYIPSN